MSEIAIKASNIYKNFRLPQEKHVSIKSSFTSLFKAKKKGITIQHALQDISFEVKKGEFFGIVGRNGSGKSTLLKMLAGIYQPTKGKIEVNGKLVPFIELGVGFNPELSGRENVYLNGALLGFSHKEIEAQYNDIVQFAELEQFMDQKLKNYSSGMQVRLAFSLATRAQADILLVDEVLAVGDASFQRKCFEYFKELKARKKTVVFVTHDMGAVREYCDRAIMIEDSRLVSMGDPNKIATGYTRMFNTEKRSRRSNSKDSDRWGNKKVEYTSIRVNSDLLIDNSQQLVITAEAVAHEDSDNPLMGFSIRNHDGAQLLGTNTFIKKAKIGNLKAGQKIKLEWTVPNIFPDGVFFVDAALESRGATQVHDWWESAAEFEVRNEERVYYPINLPIKLKVEK